MNWAHLQVVHPPDSGLLLAVVLDTGVASNSTLVPDNFIRQRARV